MERILNITNWYPNHWNKHEALFIKEHFDACDSLVEQQLWHVQVRHEGGWFRIYSGSYDTDQHYLILDTRIQSWRLQELLTFFLLILLRIKLGQCTWGVVNVHIAYPLLRFTKMFKRLFGNCIVITEHWSAYRSNFFLSDGSRAKHRLQSIFSHKIPVIAVSRALMSDIISFAGRSDFPQHILPNVVDQSIFYPARSSRHQKGLVFLMVASWAPIKLPLLAMEAFSKILVKHPDAKLRIVGYGQQCRDMENFINEQRFEENIIMLGPMSKVDIANEMRSADAFIHASQYETFSVVCAEALCCGIPVIASKVGGIPEFVNSANGLLVENTPEAWANALLSFKLEPWDKNSIAKNAAMLFSPKIVANRLLDIYQQCKLT